MKHADYLIQHKTNGLIWAATAVVLATCFFITSPLAAQDNAKSRELSVNEIELIKLRIQRINEKDQQFRPYLTFKCLDDALVERISKMEIKEAMKLMTSLEDKLTKDQRDLLNKLQLKNDVENHAEFKRIIEQYGYPSKERLKAKTDELFPLLLHPPVGTDQLAEFLDEMQALLKPEVTEGRLSAKSYAMFVDNTLGKSLGQAQLYGTNGRFNRKTKQVEPPMIESIERSNAARKEIGLPALKEGEYLLLSDRYSAAQSLSQNQEPGSPNIGEWEKLNTEAYRGKRDDISFATPTHGWYGTGKGDLFATTDSGTTWEKVASKPGTFIRALAFLDEQNGFIGNVGTDYYPGVEDETPLYSTKDGGRTWTAVDLGDKTIKGVCSIDVVNTSRIYQGKRMPLKVIHAAGRVGGPTGILRSVDGGETWTVIDMQEHAAMILDIKFFDDMNGLVFASTDRGPNQEGLILRTTDGCKTWSNVYQSGRKLELVWKASFPTSDIGYATVQSYDKERAQQLIVKTTDGGQSWSELPLVENAKARQFGIGFVDEKTGWVGTVVGGFQTSDGGKTFEPAKIAPAANKFRIVPTGQGAVVFAIGTEVQRMKIAQ